MNRADWKDLGPLFAPADAAKMCASARRIGDAPTKWRTKHELAQLAECSEHAVSARLSDLRKAGYQTEKRAPIPGSGEVTGIWLYRIWPPLAQRVAAGRVA